MAKEYKDQILDTSVNTKRVYNIVDSDGNIVAENISLEDKTVYSQEGTEFGAKEVNEIYEAIEEVNQSLTVEDITSEFIFENVTISEQWTWVQKCGKEIKMNLQFTTPPTASINLVICTLPTEYKPFNNVIMAVPMASVNVNDEQWTGVSVGSCGVADGNIALFGNKWTTSALVNVTLSWYIN